MNSRGSPTPTTRANLAITTRDTPIETHIALATIKAIEQGITIREIPDITNGVAAQVGHRRRGVPTQAIDRAAARQRAS
jgi:hypothetical protein